MRSKWGIPLIDDSSHPKKYHPRLLNAGWLVEDAETDELEKRLQALNRETDSVIIEQLDSLSIPSLQLANPVPQQSRNLFAASFKRGSNPDEGNACE